jgi:hypothetical protein
MLTPKSLLGGLALSLLLSASASAVTIVFSAPLAPEAVGATGSGTATVTFDTTLMTMRVEATWTGLSGNTSASHIHCCTTSPGVGNVGVATQVPSFAGFPNGVTAGSYDNTFDMTLAASWNPAFVTANGGTPSSAFTALLTGLQNDRAYLNIHTTTFPGGEIRARLALIPEPSTLALAAVGLAGLAAVRRSARS